MLFLFFSAWVSGVAVNPNNVIEFLSCGYDGLVKCWDVRAVIPLSSVASSTDEKERLFCVGYGPNGEWLCGGTEKRLKAFAANRK